MKKKLDIVLITVLLSASPVIADELDSSDSAFNLVDLQWYGSVNAARLRAGGEVNFFGNTASIYGGTPTVDMDDGGRVSLAIGFVGPGGWRLEGDFGYLNMRTDTSPIFGVDDRAGDSFALDAEVESLVLMVNGIYEFEMGNSRFTPFIKGGIGIARNKTTQALLDVQFNAAIWNGTVFEGQSLTDLAYPEGKRTDFAWSISAGLRMALTERFALSLEYGLIDLGEALTATDENGDALGFSDLVTEQLSLGLYFRF